MDLLGKTGNLLHKALGAESLRYQVRAQNFANINTPAYKRQDVEFEAYLAAEVRRQSRRMRLKATHPHHVGGVGSGAQPKVYTDAASVMRLDGNNVDIEREMVALTETAIRYQALAEQLTREIRQLRTVISERIS